MSIAIKFVRRGRKANYVTNHAPSRSLFPVHNLWDRFPTTSHESTPQEARKKTNCRDPLNLYTDGLRFNSKPRHAATSVRPYLALSRDRRGLWTLFAALLCFLLRWFGGRYCHGPPKTNSNQSPYELFDFSPLHWSPSALTNQRTAKTESQWEQNSLTGNQTQTDGAQIVLHKINFPYVLHHISAGVSFGRLSSR